MRLGYVIDTDSHYRVSIIEDVTNLRVKTKRKEFLMLHFSRFILT